MNITNKQALYITSYLYKGVNEKGYRDISIAIAENAVIGFERKGQRYKIYVRVSNRYDKSARGAVFTLPMEDIYELAELVKQAVENSNMLENMELDMSKVPNPSLELIREYEQKQKSLEPDETASYGYTDESMEKELSDDPESLVAPEAFHSDTPVMPKESESISLEELENEFLTPNKPVDTPDVSENTSDYDDEVFDEIPDKTEIPKQKPHENTYSRNTIHESSSYDDASAFKTANNTSSAMLQEYINSYSQSLNEIRRNSYINSIIREGFDLTEDAEKMFQKLAGINTEKAADIYIDLVCHLISECNYDIVKMSKETGVDRRNIMLAMMEKQFS